MTIYSAHDSLFLPTWSLVTSLLLMLITVLVGVVLNLLVVGIVVSRKNLRTYLNVYFINLAVCDLLICCIILILRVAFVFRRDAVDNLAYRIDLFFTTLVDMSRMFLLVGVSVERYQAVAAPFKKGTSRRLRTIVGCVTSWFVSTLLALFSSCYYENSLSHVFKGRPLHGNVNTEVYLILPVTCVCLVIIVICYILMLRHLYHHGNKMSSRLKQRGKVSPEVSAISKDVDTGSKPPFNRFSRFLNSTKDAASPNVGKKLSEVAVFEMDGSVHKETVAIDNKNNDIVGDVCVYDSKNRVAGKRRVEMRAAKRIGVVMGTFLLLWLPFPVSVVACRGDPRVEEEGCRAWLFLLACISTVTGVTNPLLYLLTNKQLKSACVSYFRSKVKCR